MDYQLPAQNMSIVVDNNANGNPTAQQQLQQLMLVNSSMSSNIITSMQPPPPPPPNVNGNNNNNNPPLGPLVAHNLSIQQQVDSNQHLHHQQHLHQQHIHHHHNNNNPQLWRHFEGKASGNSKDICGNDDKFKEDGDPWNVEAQAAFLGPNLWDKTLPYDTDLKVTHYADLDEFLSENNIPDGLPGTHLGHSTGLNHRPSVNDSLGYSTGLALGLGHITTKRERSPSPSDCVSPDTINPPSPAESTFSFASSGRDFDPRTRAFSDEELKPQPMIKKSRKQFVPDELKDDKYWARRRKNNIAAKRSRDARRQKENQIAMRARYLEKEISLQNSTLHQELEQLKQENMELRARLSKYQDA
ncbi:hepatic leukemia factor isoform X2 [Contarinia nasturtii]|uniref:hepatic leukemia factor isoform X2 n=1 Tax=Contarinia nasturtii TaxID=265458 RepID=UPI0012D47B9E|nr:hepatic leukemia factor isoform X2 [Contarinia nasturtii]